MQVRVRAVACRWMVGLTLFYCSFSGNVIIRVLNDVYIRCVGGGRPGGGGGLTEGIHRCTVGHQNGEGGGLDRGESLRKVSQIRGDRSFYRSRKLIIDRPMH